MHFLRADSLEEWRAQARRLLAQGIPPLDVTWEQQEQQPLFIEQPINKKETSAFTVSAAFMALANVVSCHRSTRRWDLLYQLLFRIQCGEKHLMHITTDPLIHALHMMEKAVRRDSHKMKAFVRFRLVHEDNEHYIAWHRPDHRVLTRVAPFFARRFEIMNWAILTPDASVHWNGEVLRYGPGVPQESAPQEDALEDLWRNYYRATFNPARIKINTMKREMPMRHWKTLPETSIISDMLAEAPARVEAMLQHQQAELSSAADFLPSSLDITELRKAASVCQGCELYQCATQTVFGEGPANARIMLVGEQPGDQEDKNGYPFAGPAGELLNELLAEAGISRDEVYITNAVKHFRFLYKDSFRQHQSPSRYHVQACKPWLTAEIAAIKPKAIVCLGNTAARALIHSNFTVKANRGQWFGEAPRMLATYHPAAVLRAAAQEQTILRACLAEDLRMLHSQGAH